MTLRRQQDVELLTALVGTFTAMAEARRFAREGARVVGRRAGRVATGLRRRAWANAVDSRRRAIVALRVCRGDEPVYSRRPAEYVGIGVVAGITGALALAAFGRVALQRPDGGPGRRTSTDSTDPVLAAVPAEPDRSPEGTATLNATVGRSAWVA